jgi:hypothetical protein
MSQQNQQLVEMHTQASLAVQALTQFLTSEEAAALPPLEHDLRVAELYALMSYQSVLTIRVKLSQAGADPTKVVARVS